MFTEQIRISDEWIIELAAEDEWSLYSLKRGFVFTSLVPNRVQFYESDVVIDFSNRRINEYYDPAVMYRIIERETGRVAFDISTVGAKRVLAKGRFIAHDPRTGLAIFSF